MGTAQAKLRATPAQPRRRAWIGKGNETSTRLVMVDQHELPLPEASTVDLVWERRPWWHLLLVVLAGVGGVGAIALLLWWLFGRALAPPKVVQFEATSSTYYQQKNDFVRLAWNIENPKQIRVIELRGQAVEGATPPQPIRYDFSDGIPTELADHCVQKKQLACSNIFTSARQPGRYQFTLNILPKGRQSVSTTAETGTITIQPTPPPEIRQFAPTQQRYWEALAPSSEAVDGSGIIDDRTGSLPPESGEIDSLGEGSRSPGSPHRVALNWQITGVDQLSYITLVGRLEDGSVLGRPQRYGLTEDLPQSLAPFCRLSSTDLVCRSLPTTAQTVGQYVFELSVFGSDDSTPMATQTTEAIAIVPAPVQIESFTIDGASPPTKYSVQLPAPTNGTDPGLDSIHTVRLAWRVRGGPFTQVELLPSPGSVPLVGELDYPLTANMQEVVTLRVTSVTGRQVTRSITLEALAPPLPLSLPPLPNSLSAIVSPPISPPPETSAVPETVPVPSPSPPSPTDPSPTDPSPEDEASLSEPSAPITAPLPVLLAPDDKPIPPTPDKPDITSEPKEWQSPM